MSCILHFNPLLIPVFSFKPLICNTVDFFIRHKYRTSSSNPPFSNKPPLFRGGKLISPPLPLSQSLFFTKKLTINVDWSVMVYSGWKFILFLVFGRMTSNFICLTSSTLRSSSLWRIVTIFLSLDKAVYRPGTTSPSSRNLAPVDENSKLQPSRDKNLHSRNDNSIGKCPTSSWSWELLVHRR